MPRSSTSAPAAPSRRRFLGLAGAGTLGAAAIGQLAAAAPASAAETSGPELGYADSTVATSTKTSIVVPNLAVEAELGAVPVCVEYGGYLSSSIDNGLVKLYLLRDGVPVHEIGCTVPGYAGGGVTQVLGRYRIPAGTPASTVLTVKLANWSSSKATASLLGSPLSPAFLLVREL